MSSNAVGGRILSGKKTPEAWTSVNARAALKKAGFSYERSEDRWIKINVFDRALVMSGGFIEDNPKWVIDWCLSSLAANKRLEEDTGKEPSVVWEE